MERIIRMEIERRLQPRSWSVTAGESPVVKKWEWKLRRSKGNSRAVVAKPVLGKPLENKG